MFKEIGDRLQNGTMNIVINQKDGKMSVIVGFKGVPGLNEALFTGTPAEIEESFIERLEQPMQSISKFNFDMDAFNAKVEAELKAKTAKKETADKTKKDKETKATTQSALPLDAPAKKDEAATQKAEKPAETTAKSTSDDQEVSTLRFTEKQKEEVVQAGVSANSGDEEAKAIAKIEHMKSCNRVSAENYYNNNIKELLEEALKHKGNVNAIKQDAEAPVTVENNKPAEEEEFDPFADDFQL